MITVCLLRGTSCIKGQALSKDTYVLCQVLCMLNGRVCQVSCMPSVINVYVPKANSK